MSTTDTAATQIAVDLDPTTEQSQKLAYSVNEAAELIGVCRRTVYELMTCGRLASVKIGRRRLVRHDDLVQFVAELEEAEL